MSLSEISKFLVFLTLCAASHFVSGQKFSYGLKVGVSGSYTNFPDSKDSLKTNIKMGFAGGGFVIFPMKENYSFVAEGGYSQQGRSYKYKINGDQWNYSYHFVDMSMALRKSFQWKLIKHVSTNWFVNIGPNINYLINASAHMYPFLGFKQTYQVDFNGTGQSYNKIYTSQANRWLYGLNVGIGFSAVTQRNQRFNTELRMTWGQTYLGKRNSEYIPGVPGIEDETSLKCNLKVLTLSVGYILERDIQKGRMGKSTKKLK